MRTVIESFCHFVAVKGINNALDDQINGVNCAE